MNTGNQQFMGKMIGAAGIGALLAAALTGGAAAATAIGTSANSSASSGAAGSPAAASATVGTAAAQPTAPQGSASGGSAQARTSSRVGAAAITEGSLRKSGVCKTACTISGRAAFDHPSWGRVTLVTTIAKGDYIRAINAAVIGKNGKVLWQLPGSADAKVNYSWKLASPASDSSGLFFINYDPGRLNGVSVLRPVNGGMKVLAGWYSNEIGRTSKFYGATLQGPGSDGLYVVKVQRNDCQPTCAKGSTKTTRYKWNGKAFAKL